ncbi:MAG TPA: hypothetical protein VHF47_05150 [Acidimicrobiales bacterium]|nr:hypothetical protein [Acidimicrobiales bacterium]
MSDESGDVQEQEQDHDVLVYELGEWTPEERARLGLLLEGEGIPHQWDGDDLLVPDAEEARVDAVLDQVEFPDQLDPVDDEGDDDEERYMVLSDLFVAMDRLANATTAEAELAGEVIAAVEAALAIPRPFGIDEPDWADVRRRSAAIAEALQSEVDDIEIIADANLLRDLLRRFV